MGCHTHWWLYSIQRVQLGAVVFTVFYLIVYCGLVMVVLQRYFIRE